MYGDVKYKINKSLNVSRREHSLADYIVNHSHGLIRDADTAIRALLLSSVVMIILSVWIIIYNYKSMNREAKFSEIYNEPSTHIHGRGPGQHTHE